MCKHIDNTRDACALGRRRSRFMRAGELLKWALWRAGAAAAACAVTCACTS